MEATWYSGIFGFIYLSSIIAFAILVIMTRRPVGVSLAWLVLLFALPVAGFGLYLLFGSRRLGTRRLKRIKAIYPDYEQWYQHLSRVIADQGPGYCPATPHNGIFQLAENTMGVPLLPGNSVQLFHDYEDIIAGILQDIEASRISLIIEFYIWEPEGRISAIAEAVISASRRGVECLVVLDAVGSRRFLNGPWAKRFRLEGISVTASMSVGIFGSLVERIDIRNHRKILVVDDDIAWTGSFNLVDPTLFRQSAAVGQWVDAMIRIEGVGAHVLGAIVQGDKILETGKEHPPFNMAYEFPAGHRKNTDNVNMHMLPSGPGIDRELLHQVLLEAIYASRTELFITTPYFVPGDSLLTALRSAAMRGVRVTVIVPEKNDSIMVHFASRSYYQDLLEAGVSIMQFRGGLLHTKCVLVDSATVLFGTVNLDMRSVWLNYEVTSIIYDQSFGHCMSELIKDYLLKSSPVSAREWEQRPFSQRLLENTLQLLSPLL